MANKIKFGTQCDETVLRAVKARLVSEDGFLGDAVELGLRLWLSDKGDESLRESRRELPAPNAKAHALIDELIARRPRTAENMLATIRALLAEEPVEAKVVPAAPGKRNKAVRNG